MEFKLEWEETDNKQVINVQCQVAVNVMKKYEQG